MLFLDIAAAEDDLRRIEAELFKIGYLSDRITEIRVIEVS
jgi:hypothetical protein